MINKPGMTLFESIGVDLRLTGQANERAICPRCSDYHKNRKKTLSCDIGRGLFLCFRCGWKGRVAGDVGFTDYKPDPKAIETLRSKRQFAIDTTLAEAVPLTDPIAQPARTYLSRRMRRILGAYPDLLFHPTARYYHDGKYVGDYPALLGEVRDINNRLVTLHRTYLTEDGCKAHLDPVRKLMGVPQGSCSGAAIRLLPVTDTLVICEGIETALALSLKMDLPAWSTISAHGLEQVVIPDSVKTIHIGADHDASGVGQRAARNLASRLFREGFENVFVHTPEVPGKDWADLMGE